MQQKNKLLTASRDVALVPSSSRAGQVKGRRKYARAVLRWTRRNRKRVRLPNIVTGNRCEGLLDSVGIPEDDNTGMKEEFR